jgi:hypothetical protein
MMDRLSACVVFVSEDFMNHDRISEIHTKEELANFIEELSEGLINAPDEWENTDLERFLLAMAAWIRSIDIYAKNSDDSEAMHPSWSTFAKILCAAKIYE